RGPAEGPLEPKSNTSSYFLLRQHSRPTLDPNPENFSSFSELFDRIRLSVGGANKMGKIGTQWCVLKKWAFAAYLIAAAAFLVAGKDCLAKDATPGCFEFSLFDGKSLDGWTTEAGCGVIAKDGKIRLVSGDGWLRTDQKYRDFDLHVEWRAIKSQSYDAG